MTDDLPACQVSAAMRHSLCFVLLVFMVAAPAAAQMDHGHRHGAGRIISFPDVPGYHSLTCDLHMHTVFSDGSVWPDIRVQEAQRDGLDCIAITEHLEYQPHSEDIPHPDRNRAYDIAAANAENSELIVIRGSEVTRRMPPGHTNAVFLQDANALLMEDPVDVFQEANDQGGFVFWNHPNWTAQRDDGIARLESMHRRLIADGLLHGVEVVNETTYSDEALQIALDHDLTIIGSSDVHGLLDWLYDVPGGGHRPVTIVFAEERSQAGIKEALTAGRTAVWFNETLIGREEYVVPLVESALEVERAAYDGDTSVLEIDVRNHSDAELLLLNRTDFTFHDMADLVILPPHHSTTLFVKTRERLDSVTMEFEALNVVTAPATHPLISFEATPDSGE